MSKLNHRALLAQSLQNEINCEVKLIGKDGVVSVDVIPLVLFSPFLKNILIDHVNDVEPTVIILPDYSVVHLRSLVKLITTGTFKGSRDDILNVHAVGDILKIDISASTIFADKDSAKTISYSPPKYHEVIPQKEVLVECSSRSAQEIEVQDEIPVHPEDSVNHNMTSKLISDSEKVEQPVRTSWQRAYNKFVNQTSNTNKCKSTNKNSQNFTQNINHDYDIQTCNDKIESTDRNSSFLFDVETNVNVSDSTASFTNNVPNNHVTFHGKNLQTCVEQLTQKTISLPLKIEGTSGPTILLRSKNAETSQTVSIIQNAFKVAMEESKESSDSVANSEITDNDNSNSVVLNDMTKLHGNSEETEETEHLSTINSFNPQPVKVIQTSHDEKKKCISQEGLSDKGTGDTVPGNVMKKPLRVVMEKSKMSNNEINDNDSNSERYDEVDISNDTPELHGSGLETVNLSTINSPSVKVTQTPDAVKTIPIMNKVLKVVLKKCKESHCQSVSEYLNDSSSAEHDEVDVSNDMAELQNENSNMSSDSEIWESQDLTVIDYSYNPASSEKVTETRQVEKKKRTSQLMKKKVFPASKKLNKSVKTCENKISKRRRILKVNLILKCYICNMKSRHTESGTQAHIRKIHRMDAGLYNCPSPSCTFRCIGLKQIKDHELTHCNNSEENEHICATCGERFAFETNLNVHENEHKELAALFECDICKKLSFKTEQNLRRHRAKHKPGEEYHVCHICYKRFSTSIKLERHVAVVHVLERKFSCEVCSRKFVSLTDLNNHKTVYKNNCKLIQCTMCSRSFVKEESFQRHIEYLHSNHRPINKVTGPDKPIPLKRRKRNHKPENSVISEESTNEFGVSVGNDTTRNLSNRYGRLKPNTCLLCEKVFGTKFNLMEHVKENHTVYNENGESYYKCSKCEETRIHWKNLTVHIRSTHIENWWPYGARLLIIKGDGVRKYKCSQCDFIHLEIPTVREHIIAEHPLKSDKMHFYKCSHCDYTSFIQRNLKLHEKVHVDAKLFVCEVCGSSFKRSSTLKEHRRRKHQGDLPLTCDICQRSYRSEKGLAEHQLRHTQRNHNCNICGKYFLYPSMLKHHMDLYAGMIHFGCNVCHKKFHKKTQLSEHLTVHKSDKNNKSDLVNHPEAIPDEVGMETETEKRTCYKNGIKCGICHKPFGTKKDLNEHKRVSHFNGGLHCNLCDKIFVTKCALREHKRHIHGKFVNFIINKCKYCNKEFSAFRNLKEHLKSHCTFECKTCDSKFMYQTTLNKHTEQCHSGYNEEQLICKICDKMCANKSSLKQHMVVHQQKKFKCSQCSAAYRFQANLQKHQEKHVVNTDRQFSCDICNTVFTLRRDLAIHKKTHSEQTNCHCPKCNKMFRLPILLSTHLKSCNRQAKTKMEPTIECKICRRKFFRTKDLERHMPMHKEYKLECPHCDMMYDDESTLTYHIQTIHSSEEQNFECNICREKFNQQHNLKLHMRTHKTMNYKCSECGNLFESKKKLVKHLRTKHS